MFRPAPALLGLVFVAGSFLSGCKSIAAIKQRCLSGDAASCESACAKGIAGEGGCFHAGNHHRELASLDFAGSEFRRAAEYFVRSCEGGYGDGCLMAAEMIEAPYAPDPASDGPPKSIPDKEVLTREKRFELACSRKSARGCKRLGDVLIGKNAERAKSAYAKACDAGASPAECKTARGNEVDQAERWRQSCLRRVADDCAHLGDLLYQVDPPRAVRLFESECELRGVAEIAGGVGHFVHDRIEQARYASLLQGPVVPPADRTALPKHAFDVLAPEIRGPVAVSEVLHAFVINGPELSACIDLDPGHAPPELGLELVIDATGDVFRARVTPASPAPTVRCIESVVRAMAFGQPPAPTVASFRLRVRDSKPAASR